MRFFVSYLRLDSEEPLAGLSVPQLVSLVTIAAGIPLLVYFMRREEPEWEHVTPAERQRRTLSRAERRRRLRGA
jgi:hypothetical protein